MEVILSLFRSRDVNLASVLSRDDFPFRLVS